MKEKDRLHQRFNRASLSKQHNLNNQPRAFEELVMFMHQKIQSEFQTFSLTSLCSGHRTKFMVDTSFQKAFTHLSLAEKVSLYEKTIQLAFQIQNSINQLEESIEKKYFIESKSLSQSKKPPQRIVLEIEKGFRSWCQIEFIIDGFKILSKELKIDIRNYLIRHSKKKNRECYVLEAIRFTDPDVVRFCFLTESDRNEYLPIIQNLINVGYEEDIRRMCSKKCKLFEKDKTSRKNSPQNKEQQDDNHEIKVQSLKNKQIAMDSETTRSKPQNPQIIEQILKPPQEQNFNNQLSEILASDNQRFLKYENLFSEYEHKNKEIPHKNVFTLMFPNQDLSQLDSQKKYRPFITSQDEERWKQNVYLFQHVENPTIFRLQMDLESFQAIQLFYIITDLPLYKQWHPQIDQAQIKLGIFSENSAICYQKHKAFSEWYNQRDFLFFRHAFKNDENFIIADKWIQNTNFIPLSPIVRGKILKQIMFITPKSKGSRLIVQCQFDHGGLLSQHHKNQLTIRYLLGFQKIKSYFLREQSKQKLKGYLKHQWKVQKGVFISKLQDKSQNSSIHDSQFQHQLVSSIDQNEKSETFYSIEQDVQSNQSQKSNKSIHQVIPQQKVELRRKSTIIQRFSTMIMQTNKEGLILLPQMYLKMKHPIYIMQNMEKVKAIPNFDNFLLKDVWQYLQQGGLKLVNKKLIEAQDSVFCFILCTLKKNIFSGKGSLNISLPVTIFNTDSNLSRICVSLGNAPQFLEAAARSQNPVQRFKLSMIFGLTNSLLFLDIEKPFNPVLGETYQCFIAGCPVYAEQISHHPPISAILMYGRGYRLHACLQGIVDVYMNVAEGINQGLYHIIFDDGQQICFQTPPAQFTGFAFGQRKFRFIKKGYYFDFKNLLFSQMKFQDQSGLFTASKWKYKDQVFAELFTVKPQFLKKFIAQFPNKKNKPSKKDVVEKYGQLTGRWTHQIFWDNKKIYSFNENLPYVVTQYPYPLNSNSKYRQDLYYREKNDLARSQIEKERLQNIQREDKKKREKHSGKKH